MADIRGSDLEQLQKSASESVDRRVKALAVAGTLGQQQIRTVKDGISLKVRAQMLKEDIIREATTRMLRLHEQEELWALEQALLALGGEKAQGLPSAKSVQCCRDILAERRRLVQQRLRSAEAIAIGKDDKQPTGDRVDKAALDTEPDVQQESVAISEGYAQNVCVDRAPTVGYPDRKSPDILTSSYWSALTGLAVSATSHDVDHALRDPLWDGAGRLPAGIDKSAWAVSLARDGWASSGDLGDGFAASASRLHAAAMRLRDAGWPPVFIFMTDEAWRFAAHLQDAVGDLLAPVVGQSWAWHLEPSLAVFLLDAGHKDGYGKQLGNSFPSPHRDHSYSASFDSHGDPKMLSVWVPLNDVEVDNGCMYVVPREFDPAFHRDAAYEHMQLVAEASASVEAELSGDDSTRLSVTSVCGFPLAGARPLPCRRGSFLAWNTNLIHWGSFCHSSASAPPRCSAAFVFRRCAPCGADEAEAGLGNMPAQVCDPEARPMDLRDAAVVQSLATVRRRLMYVLAALRYFEHWYDATSVRDKVMQALRSDGSS